MNYKLFLISISILCNYLYNKKINYFSNKILNILSNILKLNKNNFYVKEKEKELNNKYYDYNLFIDNINQNDINIYINKDNIIKFFYINKKNNYSFLYKQNEIITKIKNNILLYYIAPNDIYFFNNLNIKKFLYRKYIFDKNYNLRKIIEYKNYIYNNYNIFIKYYDNKMLFIKYNKLKKIKFKRNYFLNKKLVLNVNKINYNSNNILLDVINTTNCNYSYYNNYKYYYKNNNIYSIMYEYLFNKNIKKYFLNTIKINNSNIKYLI